MNIFKNIHVLISIFFNVYQETETILTRKYLNELVVHENKILKGRIC